MSTARATLHDFFRVVIRMLASRQIRLSWGILLLAGAIVAVTSEVPPSIGVSRERALLGAVAVIALYTGVDTLVQRRLDREKTDGHDSHDPRQEHLQTTVVGATLDESVQQLRDETEPTPRPEIEAALRQTAVDALAEFRGYSRDEARNQVLSGAWTDDEYAAAFLGGEAAQPLSRRRRLRDWFGFEHSVQKRIRRTVEEIETIKDGQLEA